MKTRTRTKGILYNITTSPFLLFFIICIGIPLLGYFFYNKTHILSLHEYIIINSINTKQYLLQKWLEDAKKGVETTASSPKVKASISAIAPKQQDNKTTKTKQKEHHTDTTKAGLNVFLEAKLTEGKFALISVISKDGIIVGSTSQDLVSHSIADTELYKTLQSKGNKTIIVGFWKNGENKYLIDLITPIKDENQETKGYLHCALKMDEIKSILEVKPRHVISYDLTDKQGNILISSENTLKENKRYTTQIINTGDKPQYIGMEVINSKGIKDIDLIIVQRSRIIDVFFPLIEVSLLYLFIVCFVIFMFIKQAFYTKKKVVKPILSIVSTLRSASAGIQTVTIKGKYPYEIDLLLQEINKFIDEISQNKTISEIKKASIDEVSLDKQTQPDMTQKQITKEGLLDTAIIDKRAIYRAIADALQGCEDTKAFLSIRQRLISLACMIENYQFLKIMPTNASQHEFLLDDFLKDIDEELSLLKSVAKTEFIFEYDNKIKKTPIKTRRDILFRIISTILHNSFASTTDGTITVLCRLNEEPTKHLLILISDDYKGDDENTLLAVVKEMCDIVGYEFLVDTIKGKGSTYYLKINL